MHVEWDGGFGVGFLFMLFLGPVFGEEGWVAGGGFAGVGGVAARVGWLPLLLASFVALGHCG